VTFWGFERKKTLAQNFFFLRPTPLEMHAFIQCFVCLLSKCPGVMEQLLASIS
jgi:hypothetical protein